MTLGLMKSARIASVIAQFQGRSLDPHYLGYFECFNQQLFYEAHEVLEQLWLPARQGPEGAFYKGLIQLAGAFVHLQKGRVQPAASLLNLAKENLGAYAPLHLQLNVNAVLRLIENWSITITSADFQVQLLSAAPPPKLELFHE